jgi:Winged helix-turn helix
MDGLRDRPRSGKPSDVSKEETDKIRKELSDSNTGWDIKQVIDLIQKKRTGVYYHKEYIRRLLHKWGFSPKVPQKRFVNRATRQEKDSFKKGYKNTLNKLKHGWNALVQDESIFLYDSIITKKRENGFSKKKDPLLL